MILSALNIKTVKTDRKSQRIKHYPIYQAGVSKQKLQLRYPKSMLSQLYPYLTIQLLFTDEPSFIPAAILN